MRLLPRSPRGIWLLAAAIFGVGCGILWLTLPVEPRARIRAQPGIWGYTSDGKSMLKQRPPEMPRDQALARQQIYTLELRSVPSDRLIDNLVQFGHNDSNRPHSADMRYWMIRDSDALDEQRNELNARFIRLDLETRSTKRFSLPRSVVQDRYIMDLSPDGRFCVLQDRISSAPAILWDLVEGRLNTPEPDIYAPILFSRDSRYLVAQSRIDKFRILVIDLWNGSTRAILKGPDYRPPNDRGSQVSLHNILLINDDATRVAAQFFDRSTGYKIYCWNIESSKIELELPRLLIGFADGGNTIVTSTVGAGGRIVETFDLPSGNSRSSFQTAANLDCLLTLDGRTLLAPTVEAGGSFWERLAARLGLPWPFSKSGDYVCCRLHDLATGLQFGEFPVENAATKQVRPIWVELIPNGSIVSVEGHHPDISYCIWDVPPRKSLITLAFRATILATFIGFVAWRLQRRLRPNPAAVT